MKIYKAYYFTGESTDSMVKIYEGPDEEKAFAKIERYENRDIQVEIWEGNSDDPSGTNDELHYPS
jgi:hypothetical protein